MSQQLSCRAVTASDAGLLYEIYASTRRSEVEAFGWPPARQEAFLRMQFDVRRRAYEAVHPAAEYNIVVLDSVPVGSMIVARDPAAIHLVDIALFPEFRNRGLGAQLVSDLIRQAAASGLAVHLSVMRGNPAIHLYFRLGFVVTSEDAMYLEMKHDPGRTQ